MGLLTDQAINFYDTITLEEIQEALIGPEIIFKAPNVPKGSQTVTKDEIKKLKGKARLGRIGQPIPRETGDVERTVQLIPEIAHGFDVHRKDLEAAARAGGILPKTAALQSSRLVAESIENMIFNGVDDLDIKGIFADAGDTYTVEEDHEWNTEDCNPFNDIVGAASLLGKYKPRKLVLSQKAYMNAWKVNTMGVSYMDNIAKLMGGMQNIYIGPSTADGNSTIIPEDGGLICDFGQNIAERYVEEEINTQSDFAMDKNQMYPFNILTYQVSVPHYLDAFVAIDNLIAEPAGP